MQKKYIFASFFMAAVLASSLAAAPSSEDVSFDSVKNFIEQKYNPNADSLPGFAKKLFGNERINIEMDGLIVGVVTKDAKAVEIVDGGITKPTVRITADKKTALEVINSENPVSALKSAVKEKRIKIKGLGAFKWLKYALSNIAMTTGRVLGV